VVAPWQRAAAFGDPIRGSSASSRKPREPAPCGLFPGLAAGFQVPEIKAGFSLSPDAGLIGINPA
jgi:hypothetical protein